MTYFTPIARMQNPSRKHRPLDADNGSNGRDAIQRSPLLLRLAYCLVLLAAILPIGLASDGWLRLVIAGVGLGLVPSIGPGIFLALALYRIYRVVRAPRTLDAPRATGLAAVMRLAGAIALYVAALSALLAWVVPPLMQAFIATRTSSAASFAQFYLELYLYMTAGIGLLGLALFESSRLLAFERHTARDP
jgi:hypothetical protein